MMMLVCPFMLQTNAYTVLAVVPASGMGSVKVLVPLPDSGFVAGSKDGVIRVFSEAGELVHQDIDTSPLAFMMRISVSFIYRRSYTAASLS